MPAIPTSPPSATDSKAGAGKGSSVQSGSNSKTPEGQ
jgi:hypothetical protein